MARKPSKTTRVSSRVSKAKAQPAKESSYFERLENEVQNNQSKLSLILGALIVVVIGILVFNFFNKPKSDTEVGPSQQTESPQQGDVSPENLPGKYTVKEGDTLFLIAEKYYGDGEKFTAIVEANNVTDPNTVEAGSVLEIPKIEGATPQPTSSAEKPTETASPSPTSSPTLETNNEVAPQGEAVNGNEKGGTITSPYGPAITGDTYTVAEGDWLSKIADRAYGDMMSYNKIAQANNISNPDYIQAGMVLTIPR